MSIRYDFYEDKDLTRLTYYIVSPFDLNDAQLKKILGDYKDSHPLERFVGVPIEIPFPKDFS